MDVFIQGMRRSGTTILFDVLYQDSRFDAYYEPFSITRTGRPGGGSGEQDVDFAARILALRRAYCERSDEVDDPDFFNYGAPRDAALELETDLPAPCREYLRGMLDAAPHTLVKFVRMYDKLAALRVLSPAAKLIHVVRDPRAVVTSQLIGRDRRRAEKFAADEKRFFRHRGHNRLWASRPIGELLCRRREYRELEGTYDVRLILLVWRYTFRRTFDEGRRIFGADYRLVRHEDLLTRPEETVRGVYDHLGLEADAAVVSWAQEHVRPPSPPFLADSERWRKAFRKVGMARELEDAGYGDLV